MRLEKGFVGTHANPRPPASEKGFAWPRKSDATAEMRAAFRKSFTQLTRGKGMNHRELAQAIYGQTRDHNGYVVPRGPGVLRAYLDGDSFPKGTQASLLAAYFRVPLSRLLQDDGAPFEPMPMIRPASAGNQRAKKSNGHKGNGAAGPAVVSHGAPAPPPSEPAPPPPKGAKPVQVKIETLPGSSAWCQVAVTGTVPMDVALGLMAFIERGTHRGGPRK